MATLGDARDIDPSARAPRVFLSYSRDYQPDATRMQQSLTDLLGAGSVWIDTMVGSGDRWQSAIEAALRAADVLVVLVGGRDAPSADPAVAQQYEVRTARDLGKSVIPVLLEGDTGRTGRWPLLEEKTAHRAIVVRRDSWDDDVRRVALSIRRLIEPASSPPAMVPPTSAPFVGRAAERAGIRLSLAPAARSAPAAVVITGPPGIGKTALARIAAEDASAHYPDGLLFAQVGNQDTAAVLSTFLRAMGVEADAIPRDVAARALLYRSRLEGRRILVVLDDVESWTGVERLLPSDSLGGALITSRTGPPDPGLAAHLSVFRLDGLLMAEGLEVLRTAAGPEIVAADARSAEQLVRVVNGVPLVLRLVAGQARSRGLTSLHSIVEEIGRAPGHEAVPRLLLDQVYEGLPPEPRRLFRLLAVLPTPQFETGLAAALLGGDTTDLPAALQALTDSALIDAAGPGRYGFSELTFEFAAARLDAEEPEAERTAAFGRAIRWIAISTAFQPEMPITRDFWTADDTLGYAPYADAIAAFIRHRGTRPPLTIGVTAPWGAGKTSLMRMVQERLDPRADRERWSPSRIYLTADARRALTPRRDDVKHAVTNRELLRRIGEPAAEPDEIDGQDLDVEPPAGKRIAGDEWRPTVWFNPWMYQNGEQIWSGLAYEIITQVTDRLAPADRERFWLALNLRRIDKQALRRRIYRQLVERCVPWLLWLSLAVVVALIGLLLAIVVPPAAGLLRLASAGLTSVAGTVFCVGALVTSLKFLGAKAAGSFGPLLRVPDPVKTATDQAGTGVKGAYKELFPDPAYESRLGFLHLVQTDMRRVLDLVATQRRPLVVFVDDLDRCSPGAVVQVIEAINLFLAGQFPNCIFVLAMEPAVVAAHVEAVYKDLAAHPDVTRSPTAGASLGWRFLEKIVQLPLSLPPPDPAGQTRRYLDTLLDHRPRSAVDAAPVNTTSQQATSPTPEPAASQPDVGAPAPSPPPAAPGTDAEEADRADRVRRLEAAIRRRTPTTGTLTAAAMEAQAEVIPGSPRTILPETSEAANRVWVELYSDDEARTAILAGVPGLASDNPREIKRFVNLFRFYRFIAQEQQLQGLPAVSGEQIAKLSVLAIRWPHLLSLFSTPFGEGATTNLGYLEGALRSTDIHSPGAWPRALRRVGLLSDKPETAADPAWAEDLRRFLTMHPAIADVATRML